MTAKEIKAKVYERYPITEKEKCCWSEQIKRNGLREAYRLRIEKEERDKEQLNKAV